MRRTTSSVFVETIVAADRATRDRAFESLCAGAELGALLDEERALDAFRRETSSLYERVRALFFLAAMWRYELPSRAGVAAVGKIPYAGYSHLLARRFEESITAFRAALEREGPNEAIASALAKAYHGLGFQTLADQVRRSVRAVRGNQWMFRIGHPLDHPLRVVPELTRVDASGQRLALVERTPVRMDLSHSAWSDIFFLGMDFPEGARVLNVSVDLGVRGRDPSPQPPIECVLRVVDAPVLRLTSIDLGASADVSTVAEVFDFARDYLGLLKAAVIASGIVPSGLEGSGASMATVLGRVVGPGRGLELISRVRDIPKGSRLAVSTNLLGSLIAVCMRATGQTEAIDGSLAERERRTVAARAILGEWLGGSGGGWQDSGGVWPGMKLITGRVAAPGDPEYGVSRGRLLPDHELLDGRGDGAALGASIVLVHGGMAQNVGPVLEMVTEKYLLRTGDAWSARQDAVAILDDVRDAACRGELRALGEATTRNFAGPIQTIVPWANNAFTERVIERVRDRLGSRFWGFCMLGGMSGGGMAFLFDPAHRDAGVDALRDVLGTTKRELEFGLPFAMEPVVYDFAVNGAGTSAAVVPAAALELPSRYDELVAQRERTASVEVDRPAVATPSRPGSRGAELDALLERSGFDRQLHDRVAADLRRGRIGLAQNRLPANTVLDDVAPGDVVDVTRPGELVDADVDRGREAIANGEVAVVTLAAGAASRWTGGAGVVKALHPFARLGGGFRSFLDVHVAKTRRVARELGVRIPHVFTTSLFTHEPIARAIDAAVAARPDDAVAVSASLGRAVGLRLVPTERDLRFLWEETAQQQLDERAQKMRESLHAAWIAWARAVGEGADYVDNLPMQCLHPIGHWFEVPNLLRNGVLAGLLERSPRLRWLLVTNVDTLGADVDAGLLGRHVASGACLSYEVVPRTIDDTGGGLARVDGRVRIVEGLAMPREEDELALSYYNSLTTWVDLDRLLAAFGLSRETLADRAAVDAAVRAFSLRMPTYVTIKDVKKRWGNGQEDVFPVAQFEKLWGDMTAQDGVDCAYFAVPRSRGQQLKDPAQLDGWVRDGSAAQVDALCAW